MEHVFSPRRKPTRRQPAAADTASVQPLERRVLMAAAVYQAEDAVVERAARADDNAGYTGTGYVDFVHGSGDAISWRVAAQEAGRYRLAFRYANGTSADRPLRLIVNGQIVTEALSFPSTGRWDRWQETTIELPLAARPDNFVQVSTNVFNGANIDSLTVTPADDPPPQELVFQAEGAALEGPVVRRDNAGYVGNGYADFVNNTGDTVTFSVGAETEGVHVLTFRYANGSNADRPLMVVVNDVIDRRVSFPPTGGWNRWDVARLEVHLERDPANQVVMRAIGSSGPNVDELRVRRPDDVPPPARTLEAEDAGLTGPVVRSTHSAFTGRGGRWRSPSTAGPSPAAARHSSGRGRGRRGRWRGPRRSSRPGPTESA